MLIHHARIGHAGQRAAARDAAHGQLGGGPESEFALGVSIRQPHGVLVHAEGAEAVAGRVVALDAAVVEVADAHPHPAQLLGVEDVGSGALLDVGHVGHVAQGQAAVHVGIQQGRVAVEHARVVGAGRGVHAAQGGQVGARGQVQKRKYRAAAQLLRGCGAQAQPDQ